MQCEEILLKPILRSLLQGCMQDFCNGVSISKKLAADKINATGEFKDM